MSLAAFASPARVWDAGASRLWLAAAALVGFAVVLQIRFGMMGDVAWLIDCDERWLKGEIPYVDFIEINPPASLLLYWPAVSIARALHLTSELVVSGFGFALAGAALAMSDAIVRRAAPLEPAVRLTAVLALVLLPGQTFCERDHLAAVLGAPFVALMLARAQGAPARVSLAVLAGIGAGLMICVKPPYGLVAGLPALYVLRRQGWRAALVAPEYAAAAATCLAYVGAAAWFFPHYAENVLPFLLHVYAPLRESLGALVASPGFMIVGLIGVPAALLVAQRGASPPLVVFGLAALGATLAYLVQGKGWIYQAAPAMMFAAVAGAAALGPRARGEAAALAVAGLCAAFGVSWLASLGLAWCLGIAAGFAWEAARTRSVKFDLPRLAPLALAAAIGAACGLCLIGKPLTPALEAKLASLGPGVTLGAISEDEGLSFPLVREARARWVMRSHSLIVSAAARRLRSMHPGDAVLAARLQPFIDRDKAALLADLAEKHPEALLIGPLRSKLHADLAADPAVQAVLADYRLVEREESPDYSAELWVRKDRPER